MKEKPLKLIFEIWGFLYTSRYVLKSLFFITEKNGKSLDDRESSSQNQEMCYKNKIYRFSYHE